ncbi:MAG: acyltransferase [Marivivens sp.]|nr:acyltransferase [Marivivens sp.]
MSWFLAIAETLQYVPTPLGRALRAAFYRGTLAHVGEDVQFHLGSIVTDRRTRIGAASRIGPSCSVGYAEIGARVLFAQSIHVLSGRHQHTNGSVLKCVRIGDDSWIGAGAVIMGSVGEGSIVGAGAVVTKDYGADHILVGNPARPK